MHAAADVLEIFVITAPGLEHITAAEIERLGMRTSVERGGVTCKGSIADVMRLNLWLRTATRVIVRIASFHASEFHELERRARRVAWTRFLPDDGAVNVSVTCRKSRLMHTGAVAQRIFDAIERSVKGATHQKNGQELLVRVAHDVVTISVDSSGELLHRRGYRLATAKAPIRETLAAAMLLSADWNAAEPLVDPLCGSGTIPIEAALIARNIAPGRSREFAFQRWPGFDRPAWDQLIQETDSATNTNAIPGIYAADRDPGAVAATIENADRAGIRTLIACEVAPMSESISKASQYGAEGLVVANPPYGKRVAGNDPRNLYATLGKLMRSSLPRWKLVLVSNESRLVSQLKMSTKPLFRASNGGIPVEAVLATA